MPLFEYACRSCASGFEEIRKFDERLSAPACPKCGSRDTVLRLSAPAFVGAASAAGSSCDAPGGCCGGLCRN
ncbi:MAG TPA: zinc ribbon domain-containing protein [Longimicrobiales bacterium]|nr:zinc ribbon domain-containing protein [Longimicrobiales bacterium]